MALVHEQSYSKSVLLGVAGREALVGAVHEHVVALL